VFSPRNVIVVPCGEGSIRFRCMEFRFLGRSGLLVSEIAYGNWITHGGQIGPDAVRACVRAALDAGITTFDTADVYADTRAEVLLGENLRGERREGLEILTKVYFPTGPGKNDRGLSRKHILESINGSLRRLGTDYVDLYQAHRYDVETPLEETMQALADVVRSGKAIYVGVSEWTAQQIREAAALARELRLPLIASQTLYNMTWRVNEAEIIPASVECGLGQIAWSPLSQGVLTGKYKPGQPIPAGSRAADSFGREMMGDQLEDDLLKRVAGLLPLAAEAGLTPAQMALAWVLQNPNVATAITGASRPEQVTENAKASGAKLSADLLLRIDEVLGPVIERDPANTFSRSERP
jgi:aryl-alcohol dehydrogenase-like predicted oxidoreductase